MPVTRKGIFLDVRHPESGEIIGEVHRLKANHHPWVGVMLDGTRSDAGNPAIRSKQEAEGWVIETYNRRQGTLTS